MKTNYFLTKKTCIYSLFGLFTLIASSCGSYQNTSYYDNDGIYGGNEKTKTKEDTKGNSSYYKEYFSSLNKENEQLFTDVEKYSSQNDTIKKNEPIVQNNTSYTGWGSNTDNVTINIYNNGWYTPSWGYYGNYWGWNNGWYGNYWGYNGWYSPSWGWGWNSWYGNYGYGYNPYGYYGNNWGWNNGNLGHNYAYSGGRRNTNFISNGNGGGYISNRRTSATTTGRTNSFGRTNSLDGTRITPGTRTESSSTRNNTYSTPRNYNPAPTYTPTSTPSSSSTPRSYTPPTRTYTPSSSGGGSYGGSSGGGSYGGSSGGGRSGGGGGRR
jgi:hypothetical protein